MSKYYYILFSFNQHTVSKIELYIYIYVEHDIRIASTNMYGLPTRSHWYHTSVSDDAVPLFSYDGTKSSRLWWSKRSRNNHKISKLNLVADILTTTTLPECSLVRHIPTIITNFQATIGGLGKCIFNWFQPTHIQENARAHISYNREQPKIIYTIPTVAYYLQMSNILKMVHIRVLTLCNWIDWRRMSFIHYITHWRLLLISLRYSRVPTIRHWTESVFE